MIAKEQPKERLCLCTFRALVLKYETIFLDKGKVINPDLLASAIKEATSSSSDKITDNQITLILPQEAFYFVRTQVPLDIAPSAMNSFIADKARSIFPVDPTDCLTSTFIRGTDKEKIISFFGLLKDIYQDYFQALSLIDLKIQAICKLFNIFFCLCLLRIIFYLTMY